MSKLTFQAYVYVKLFLNHETTSREVIVIIIQLNYMSTKKICLQFQAHRAHDVAERKKLIQICNKYDNCE